MKLFELAVHPEKLHKNFKVILDPARDAERAELQRWAEGFPDRDNKFVQELQTTFNSSFWELYLNALFTDYGFDFDWSHASPDFHLKHKAGEFIVEATTANAADGKAKEWEKDPTTALESLKDMEFGPLNKEAMIRISNALLGKLRAYRDKYQRLDHVKGKPFVVAIAPFEQPNFQYQYDRPIRAVLFDHYVDEDAYLKNPSAYPNGPEGVSLGFVEKANGASVPLGIFLDDQWAEISAVVFSCVATWGKVDVLCRDPKIKGVVNSTWASKPHGRPVQRTGYRGGEYTETIADGVQVFHNPNARHPLSPEVFRRSGVVQHYFDSLAGEWVYEEVDSCLHVRSVMLVGSAESFPGVFAPTKS